MEFVFGGAYQGKLDYATDKYNTDNVLRCSAEDEDIDFSYDIISQLEEFVYGCVAYGRDPVLYLREHEDELKQVRAVLVKDISQGLRPKDPVMREWRRQNSLVMRYLAETADNVTRVFCGLTQKLK